jgi:hypothetical protein
VTIAALLLAAGILQAAPASPDALPFGLQKLAWGMTPGQARGQYPALDGAAMEPGQPVPALTLQDYAVADCRFTVTLTFERGRLGQIDLDSNGAAHLAACNARLKRLLQDQYGGASGGVTANSHGFSEYGSWSGPLTDVSYGELDGAFIQVKFMRAERRG